MEIYPDLGGSAEKSGYGYFPCAWGESYKLTFICLQTVTYLDVQIPQTRLQSGLIPKLRRIIMRGSGLIWTIVGVLAIIALAIWIFSAM